LLNVDCKGEEEQQPVAKKAPSTQVEWEKPGPGEVREARKAPEQEQEREQEQEQEESACSGIEVASASQFKLGKEGGALLKKIEDASALASEKPGVREGRASRLVTEYYLLTDAFAATGYRTEALRRKLDRDGIEGRAHVELVRHHGQPEMAKIFDDAGNHVNIVSYLWNKELEVHGAVFKNAMDRMLGIHLYCRGDKDLFVHELNTFRVHRPFVRKVTLTKDRVGVQFVDGHDQEGELPFWSDCEELAWVRNKAALYQSPWGVHRQVFDFDQQGNLTGVAQYDLKGGKAEDLFGVAKKTFAWAGGKVREKAYYSKDKLLLKSVLQYDDKGRVVKRAMQDSGGSAVPDFLGVAAYEFQYDEGGKVSMDTRRNVAGEVFEHHTFEYGIFSQVTQHKVLDGKGKVRTTYVHEFNDKGARTKLGVYDGDSKAGKLKLDYNGVAVYLFEYTDKGKLLKEARYGVLFSRGAVGTEHLLVNGLDGWAVIENTYTPDGRRLENTKRIRVDHSGKPIYQEVLDEDGRRISLRLQRPFPMRTVLGEIVEVMQGQAGPEEEKPAAEDPANPEAAAPARKGDDIARYYDRLEKHPSRYGSLRLQYFPQDARVTIVQRTFCLDSPDDLTAEECAQPVEIKNLTHELQEGEEIPYLLIENLPIRERGMLCLKDRRFYPEDQQFCPGHEQCRELADKGETSEECSRHALVAVQRCLRHNRYYVEKGPGIITCGDGETLADPAMVPQFEYRYEFLFERRGFLPAVVSYAESDWVYLGSGKYTIPFPKDFALLRNWQALRPKYAEARRKMRCWRLEWDDVWEDYKRRRVRAVVREKRAAERKKEEEKTAVLKKVRAKHLDAVQKLEAVRTAPGKAAVDPATDREKLRPYMPDVNAYLQSVDDYSGSEPYEELLLRLEGDGRFLEYLMLAYLNDYDAFNDALARYATSRQVNYRRDAEKRGVVPSDELRGVKDAMEIAWWTGSAVAFDEWYYRLWGKDAQSCLKFIKERDGQRYEEDLKHFGEMVGKLKEQLRVLPGNLDSFLKSAALKESGELQVMLTNYAQQMTPMLMTDKEYQKLRQRNPNLPTYREAVTEIINGDIHLRYFGLLKLKESPEVFDREFRRLGLRGALEVARYVDPARYVYLADLVWLKEMVNRYGDSVPMLTDSLSVGIGLYQLQLSKLKKWSRTKSLVVTEYRRGKRFAASLLKEPYNVQRALARTLKTADLLALLCNNLEDFEEAAVSTHAAAAMEELRDEFESGQRDSYIRHVDSHNQQIRMDAGFQLKEWESITKELEKGAENAAWYSSLAELLDNRRLDCGEVLYPEPDGFRKWHQEVHE